MSGKKRGAGGEEGSSVRGRTGERDAKGRGKWTMARLNRAAAVGNREGIVG